ncbi:MAG: TIGR04141 family sporadically distributed protein [Lactobacillus sp.]|nr:TIGR04141 family sporadically distributed protein [Lactobacillus sp.]
MKDEVQSKVDSSMKNKLHLKQFYIAKSNMGPLINKGIIMLSEETLDNPFWLEYVEEVAIKKSFNFSKRKEYRGLIFLRVLCGQDDNQVTKSFVLAFGGAQQFLNYDYIVTDFGIKICKSLVEPNEVSSVDSLMFDRKIINTRKQSAAKLLPDKIIPFGEYNVIKSFHGQSSDLITGSNRVFKIGGKTALNLSGKLDLKSEIAPLLSRLGEIYMSYTKDQEKFKIADTLDTVKTLKLKNELDNYLGERILKAINNSNQIDGRMLKGIKIQPQEIFELDNFNGFFITGMGYKYWGSSGDFNIDEKDYFEKFRLKIKTKKVDSIIKKLKTDEIQKIVGDVAPVKVCSVYQALCVEISYKRNKYILISGNWYKIDKDFYMQLKREINSIPSPSNEITYIPFDSKVHVKQVMKKKKLVDQKSEGKYNESLAEHNQVLMLDRTQYSPGPDILKKIGVSSGSNIEISDIFFFNDQVCQFIHIKRHSGGASGTSHLLSQAIASARLNSEDKENIHKFINAQINIFNQKSGTTYQIPSFTDLKQKKQIILGIIDKNTFKPGTRIARKNSELFSLLEMLSVKENINNLKNLGYECFIKFIDADDD